MQQLPGFDIGPVHITYYGIILMTGAVMGAWLAVQEARRRGQDSEIVWDGLIWVLIAGIIGARIWHILFPASSNVEFGLTTQHYLTHPLDAIDMRKGGLGIPGAVIGGGLALFWFCKRRGISFLLWADIAVPGLALGQAIGRWGNFINQELYGRPSDLPWAIRIDQDFRLPGFENFEYFHPLFLYESLWNFANMALLLWLGRRYSERLRSGDLLLTYLIVYPLGRFCLEFLRLDTAIVGGINANQALMALIALVAAGTLYWRHRGGREETITASRVPPETLPEQSVEIINGTAVDVDEAAEEEPSPVTEDRDDEEAA